MTTLSANASAGHHDLSAQYVVGAPEAAEGGERTACGLVPACRHRALADPSAASVGQPGAGTAPVTQGREWATLGSWSAHGAQEQAVEGALRAAAPASGKR
jgi:hypothetical protein